MDYAGSLSFPYRDELREVLPSPTLNLVGERICSDIEEKVESDGTVLVVGCGDGGEGIHGFSEDFIKNNVVGIDIRNTTFTDVVGDVKNLPIKGGEIDAVICQATLEHIDHVDRALIEIVDTINEGGYLYIDIPFIQGYHALPTDYRRYTSEGLRTKIENRGNMKTHERGASKGPTSSLIWILCEYTAFIFSFGNYRARKIVSVILRTFIFWTKYLDKILVKTHGFDDESMPIPSAVYWYGQKMTDSPSQQIE